MPDGMSGEWFRRRMDRRRVRGKQEESHPMSRLIAFRRLRTDRRQNDPTSPVDVALHQPVVLSRHLPRYTDLAEVVLNRNERTFARRTDGTLHERFALEAVINALSSPSPALDAAQPTNPPHRSRDHEESNAA